VLIPVVFLAMLLPIVGVGYLAVRGLFHEIPLGRSDAIAMSSGMAAGLLAAWLTIALFGFAIGQTLGNERLGSLIGGVLGVTGWVMTTVAFGTRITRRLAELQVMVRASRQLPDVDSSRGCLRVGLAAIFVVAVVFVAGAVFAALIRTNGP
jgi:hypothetical protein